MYVLKLLISVSPNQIFLGDIIPFFFFLDLVASSITVSHETLTHIYILIFQSGWDFASAKYYPECFT